MKAQNKKTNLGLDHKSVRFAGILYLSLVPLGIFGIIYVPSSLIVTDNITATISNIIENETLFRWSIISALVVQLVNIILVLLLFKVFKPINKAMAILMVIFSLAKNSSCFVTIYGNPKIDCLIWQ